MLAIYDKRTFLTKIEKDTPQLYNLAYIISGILLNPGALEGISKAALKNLCFDIEISTTGI
jgi:hypothetical protein